MELETLRIKENETYEIVGKNKKHKNEKWAWKYINQERKKRSEKFENFKTANWAQHFIEHARD